MAALIWGLLLVSSPLTGGAQASAQAPNVSPASTSVGQYSEGGSKTCLGCHNVSPVNNVLHSAHWTKGDTRSPAAQHECESCHGPSRAHVEGFEKGAFVEPAVVFKGPHISP